MEEVLEKTRLRLVGVYGERKMRRVKGFIDNFLGREVAILSDVQQRNGSPSIFWVPGIDSVPWYEVSRFPWVEQLEDAYAEIMADLHHGLRGTDYDFDGITMPDGMLDETVDVSVGWDNICFIRSGFKNKKSFVESFSGNIARFPVVWKSLATVPLAMEARISILAPGGSVLPHCSTFNGQLVMHLGLQIPDGCAIKVLDEERVWHAGKCLIFDDTYEHSTWNNGPLPRIVILASFWHPSLSAEEIVALKAVFDEIHRVLPR